MPPHNQGSVAIDIIIHFLSKIFVTNLEQENCPGAVNNKINKKMISY